MLLIPMGDVRWEYVSPAMCENPIHDEEMERHGSPCLVGHCVDLHRVALSLGPRGLVSTPMPRVGPHRLVHDRCCGDDYRQRASLRA